MGRCRWILLDRASAEREESLQCGVGGIKLAGGVGHNGVNQTSAVVKESSGFRAETMHGVSGVETREVVMGAVVINGVQRLANNGLPSLRLIRQIGEVHHIIEKGEEDNEDEEDGDDVVGKNNGEQWIVLPLDALECEKHNNESPEQENKERGTNKCISSCYHDKKLSIGGESGPEAKEEERAKAEEEGGNRDDIHETHKRSPILQGSKVFLSWKQLAFASGDDDQSCSANKLHTSKFSHHSFKPSS